ncbi:MULTISPECIES: flippase-like domain-containing protein [Methanocalculus]|uniref:flippase-like domain-containing protein n=1 Tax=Methanocalculus TaxID=71151 RepID=UPI0020A0B2A6|nr:flippase-like domain-containing protein [Methanocalculus sp. AMF5]MCP1662611.1 uncharacterized protein (TIRG00374 family) [Methanocalculus sp. AMF5]
MKLKRTHLLALGVLIITVALYAIGIEEISTIAGRMTLSGLVLLTALQLFTLLLTAYIWFFLLRQKSDSVRLFPVFLISMAGVFVESITPSVKIGGETMKIYLMKQETGLSYSELAAVAIVSKFYYFLPFLAISLVTLGLAFTSITLPGVVYLAFAGVLLLTLLFPLFFRYQRKDAGSPGTPVSGISTGSIPVFTKLSSCWRRAAGFIGEAADESRHLLKDSKKHVALFLLALVVWVFYPVKVYIVSLLLGYEISIPVIIIATFTAYLVSMVPLLPGGLVTFEGTMVLVLVSGGLLLPEAFSIAILSRVITFWIPLLLSAGVTFYLFSTRTITPAPDI